MIANLVWRLAKWPLLLLRYIFNAVMAMFRTAHPSSQQRGMTVRFLNADITQVQASAVVTGEGPDLERVSGVTTSLLQVIPELLDERRRHKQHLMDLHRRKQYLPFGAVLISDVKRSRRTSFQYVLHAVLDTVRSGEKQWLRDMGVLYKEIFRTADHMKISCLAVPLLGSGVATADKYLAIRALASAVVNCKTRYPTQLLIVCNDDRLLDTVHRNFDSSQGETGGVLGFLRSVVDQGRDFFQFIMGSEGKIGYEHHRWPPIGQSSQHVIKGDVGYRHVHPRRPPLRRPGQREEEKRQLNEAIQNSMIDNRSDDISKTRQKEHGPVQKHQRSVDVNRARNPNRHRQGHNTGYPSQSSQQSDEAWARSLQHEEELRSGKRSSEEYLKHTRNVDDSESEDRDDDEELNSTSDTGLQDNSNDDEEETCSICLNTISDPKKLDKCGHVFCKACIERSFLEYKPVCPSCNMVYGEIRGNQPDGQMDVGFSGEHLPGYEDHGTITITYYFPSGTQDTHPNPGQSYKGTTRRAYLPDNTEGRTVLKLLRIAFDRRLTFTIGRSTTTGKDGVVTWNDIHHKTNKDGGPTRFGYPDATYLSRVTDELASKGVTE